MDSQIEEIKNKLNVVDVVSGYVKLSKTGVNFRGVCPFHSEKGPSFFVSPTRQMWHCFGCGLGGSIFDFVMKIEGIEFGDALRILANKAGVELKRENPKLRTERQRLYEICNLSCSFFEKQLEGIVGKQAKEYLLKRGITDDSIKKWRLGYSPDTWQSLSDFLIGRGYTRQEIVKAGLAVEKEGNRADSYDRFRGRIIFPIFDANSQVIGFGARVFKDAQNKEIAKYINTPQTMLYDKSHTLYGINNAKLSIRKKSQCVITEGYTDTIMCHQAGFDNTIATSGTALTSQHLNILKRYTDNLLLAFDMDVAGDSATKRGINLAEAQGFNIKIIDNYDNAKDPAEIILENPSNWTESLKQARSIMDYYFDSAFKSRDKTTPGGKKEIAKIILPAIKRLPNKIEQSHWIQKLSSQLNIREDAIIEELKGVKVNDNFTQNSVVELKKDQKSNNISDSVGRKKLIEEKVMSLIFKDPENLNLIQEPHYNLFCDKTRQFVESLKKITLPDFANASENKDFKTIFANVEASGNQEYMNFLTALSLRAEVDFQEDGSEEIQLCLTQLRDICLRDRLGRITSEIRLAEESNDNSKLSILKEEFNKLSKELHEKKQSQVKKESN